MGKRKVVYSPIQLQMEIQYYIYLIDRLQNVEVNLVGVKVVAEFEVIEIMVGKICTQLY
jgi:hypothetical protein